MGGGSKPDLVGEQVPGLRAEQANSQDEQGPATCHGSR
jgi:hypothetical protein